MREPQDIRALRTLNRVMRALLDGATYDEKLDRTMGEVLAAMGAERGYLVVPHGGRFEVRAVRNWSREEIDGGEGAVSRSIVKSVLDSGEAVVLDNAMTSDYGDATSIQDLGLASILAAPIPGPRGTLGVVYLESRRSASLFGPADRDLLIEVLSVSGKVLAEVIARDEAEARARAAETSLLAGERFPGIITAEPAMLAILSQVAQVAQSDVPILILGESGTGKELIARAIHLNSPRAAGPFVTVNCGAFAAELLESELYGHVKGAFTGAVRDRTGLVQAASGGTLFLDEIGEMSPGMQVKLLRTIQFGEYKPVGSDRAFQADVRFVSATHRDLEQAVEAGTFRKDLHFRINTITLELPPLRERPDDLPLLIDHFARKIAARRNLPLPTLDPELLEVMTAYDWPGNVRELENEVERMMALAGGRGAPLASPLLSRRVLEGAERPDPRHLASRVGGEERAAILDALEKEGGNRTRAAKRLGVSRETLRVKMKKHQIS